MTGWDLLDAASSGNEEAWRSLLQQHHPGLVRMAALLTGSLDAAKDVAQESFIRLLRSHGKYHRGNFKAYLSTIAYRLALKARQWDLKNRPLENHLTDDSPSPLDTVLEDERNRCLLQVISVLDARQRDVLVLRFYGQRSYEEIAGITGVPLGTVKSRLFYAVKECQRKLREKGVL